MGQVDNRYWLSVNGISSFSEASTTDTNQVEHASYFIQQLFFYLYWNLSLQRSCSGIFITSNKHRHLKLILQDFLRDRNKVQQLVQLFDPFVRAFDEIAGERVSMRVRIYKQKHIRNFAGYFFYELMLLIRVSEWEKKGEKDELILCFSTG